jgi:DNA-binding response OmpR family regulator
LRILVAEDDKKLAENLRQVLAEQGNAVDVAHDGQSAWLLGGTEAYDVIILDIMLPKRTGLDVLRNLRESNISIPVLLLTARDTVTDKVTGLDLGADDYMTKPFALTELLARVRSLSRRKGKMEPPVLFCSDLTINTSTHQAFRGKRELSLTAKEFSLLVYLLTHKGTVVTHSDIVEKVWDVNFDMFSDVLKVMISRLRKKMEAEGEKPLIHTVRGVGYILKDPSDGDEAEK